MLIVSVVAGLVFATLKVRRGVESYPEFNLAIESVELEAASCAWLPEGAQKDIEAIPTELESFNLLSEGVMEKVERRFAANPWVRKVCSVEKVFPDKIEFSLVVRRPVAWVARGHRLYLTDSEGVSLPVVEKDRTKAGSLPVITGVSASTYLPGAGAKWRSRQILEGIAVAEYLLSDPASLVSYEDRIQSIDVSAAGPRGRGVTLITSKNKRIEWGRTKLSREVQLLSEEKKLESLQLVLKGESSLGDRSYYLLWTTPTAGPVQKNSEDPR